MIIFLFVNIAQALNKTYTRQQQDVQSHEQRTTRPRKPVNKKPIPRARPVSAPMDRSMIRSHIQPPINHKIEPDFIGEQSPFVTYGAHNEKLVTGTKKTHNIRASAEVCMKYQFSNNIAMTIKCWPLGR